MRTLIVVLSLFVSGLVFPWGQTGHRVVGEIAEKHLNDQAKAKIDRILKGQTLAEVSNWMDDIKSDNKYDSLYSWHWVTIPDGTEYDDTEKNKNGDIIFGIEFLTKQLKKGGLTPELEAKYIKLLVHLVGDIHQPLHVGNGNDKGGNEVKVEWFRKSSNIHRVWDSQMIDSKNYSYTEMAALLNNENFLNVKMWQSSGVKDWAHECMKYREQIYDLPKDRKISYEYRYKNWDLLCNQLRKGGVRLAGLLNEIYS